LHNFKLRNALRGKYGDFLLRRAAIQLNRLDLFAIEEVMRAIPHSERQEAVEKVLGCRSKSVFEFRYVEKL
jgi:hypothetical protein